MKLLGEENCQTQQSILLDYEWGNYASSPYGFYERILKESYKPKGHVLI